MKQREQASPTHTPFFAGGFFRHGASRSEDRTVCAAILMALVFGAGAVLQAVELAVLPAPIVTPNGGVFDQPQVVTITQPEMAVLAHPPGWRIGAKHSTEKIETVVALATDGRTGVAMRARTNTDQAGKYPCANLSPDRGGFPFHIWSLADMAGGYEPSLFAGVTEALDWDGANHDFYFGETGNRVFLLLRQWENKAGSGGGISLWSCANGKPQASDSQKVAEFDRMPMRTYAEQPVLLEFSGEKVRVRIGKRPLVCEATDADGWVSYTGNAASGRVPAALGPTRFWFSLAGGEFKGEREFVVSDLPPPVIRFSCDGTKVTESSPVLNHPLTITHTVELRARSFYGDQAGSKETVAKFISKMPLLPEASYVSPLYLTIPHAPLDGTAARVSMDGPHGIVEATDLGNARCILRYPLTPNTAIPLILRRNGISDFAAKVAWRPLTITANAGDNMIAIRRGETLLLSASAGPRSLLRLDVAEGAGPAYKSFTGKGSESFPVSFDRAGTFCASAMLDGVPSGVVTVRVDAVDLKGPIACQVGFKREKPVTVFGSTNDIFFTSSDPAIMDVRVGAATTEGVHLIIAALQYGKPVLQVRLGSPRGPVIAEQPVDVFTFELTGSCRVGIAGKPTGIPMAVQMRPYLPNLQVTFCMEATMSTFDGNARSFSANTSAATTSTGRPGFRSEYDKEVKENIGILDFSVEVPEGESGWAFGSGVSVTEGVFPYTRVGGM